MQQQALVHTLPSLDAEEIQTLEDAVARFTPHQLQWASGFLAGLAAAQQQDDTVVHVGRAMPPAVLETEAGTLTVLYGSQTGNGESVAGV